MAIKYSLNSKLKNSVQSILNKLEKENIASRFWNKDPFIWKENPNEHKELSNRLGWLDLPFSMEKNFSELENFALEIKTEFSNVLLLGMGGSSLCPEVLSNSFGSAEGYPTLEILDSTHPNSIRKILNTYDLKNTLFIVSSKSGGTIETMSFYHTFFNEITKFNDNPGYQFVALTDPNTSLEKLAKEKKFRKIFSTPEDVGGRFSALTHFGLVPAALIGIDLQKYLLNVKEFAAKIKTTSLLQENEAFYLGALLGQSFLAGIDKLTFFVSAQIKSLPYWIEQLVAESTGKEGKGILPIVDENFSDKNIYGNDRLFVFITLENDNSLNEQINYLSSLQFPIVEIKLNDIYDLSKEFYRWEIATGLAGVIMKINPFDQPNVQAAKTLAIESLNYYKENKKLLVAPPILEDDDFALFGMKENFSIKEYLQNFLETLSANDYFAILAFLPYSKNIENYLNVIRHKVRDKYKVATTLGFGPRYLHSTGQLHKGGKNNGKFILLTNEITDDILVADEFYSYGILITAQAIGDFKALVNLNRNAIRIHIKKEIEDGLKKLYSML